MVAYAESALDVASRRRRMRVGVVPHWDPSCGGLHQYTRAMLESLVRLSESDRETEYAILSQPRDEIFLRNLNVTRWSRVPLKPPLTVLWTRSALRRVWGRVRPSRPTNPSRIRHRPEYALWWKRHGVDWLLYTAASHLSFEAGVPYVMPVHDLQHRLHPMFPEVSADGEWEWREYLFRNGVQHATLVLADSEVGKEDIIECYGIASDRVKVLPYLPPDCVAAGVDHDERMRIRAAYRLPDRYLFYPAQFWPHKNHLRIVRAMELLKGAGTEVHAVFCGHHTGSIRERTFAEVMTAAHRLQVAPQVRYLGYVPDADMPALYAEALALIMPTFFGPTNIPVLEAWALGCPVLTSDIRGIREQVGDAGVLADPESVEALADGIGRLWDDAALRRRLAERGRRRANAYTRDDFERRLTDIMREAGDSAAAHRPT